MNSGCLVSITTVCFNSEKTIKKAIESVLDQTYPFIEYIVKDGGSTDSTLSIVNSFSSLFKRKGYLFRVVSSKDKGMYDALNQANIMATGLIIGNVNSDDYLEPNAVEVMVDAYKTIGFDMAYADLRVITKKGQKIKKSKISRFPSSRHWNHPTTFIKKEVLVKEKYKCESMYDDFDLMLRIRKKYKVIVVHKTLSNFVFGGMSEEETC